MGIQREYHRTKQYLIDRLSLISTSRPDNRVKSGELRKKVNRQFQRLSRNFLVDNLFSI